MDREFAKALETLPEHMRYSIQGYIDRGQPVGGFLTALLSNDLMEAFARADDQNIAAMKAWVKFLYNHAPNGCHGSSDKVVAWQRNGGLAGHALNR